MESGSTKSYELKLMLETAMQSLEDAMEKIQKEELTPKQGNYISATLSGMTRIVGLESKLLKKSTPELLEKVKQIREKTTARIMKFKEESPDVQVEAFEEWLKYI